MKRIMCVLISLMFLMVSCVAEEPNTNMQMASMSYQESSDLSQDCTEISSKDNSELEMSKEEISTESSIEENNSQEDDSSKEEIEIKADWMLIPEYAVAEWITPSKVLLIKDGYPTKHGGRDYILDGKVFDTVKKKAYDYISETENSVFDEKFNATTDPDLIFTYDNTSVSHDRIKVSVGGYNINNILESDSVQEILQKTKGKLASLLEYEEYNIDNLTIRWEYSLYYPTKCYIYEKKDEVVDSVFSAYTKYIELTINENNLVTYITAYNITEFDTYEFDAISYEEAYNKLQNGEYEIAAFSSPSDETKEQLDVKACEFKYVSNIDNFGSTYCVPVYCFYVLSATDKNMDYKFYVPAFDVNEANNYLDSKGLPLIKWDIQD